jgi:hypothetical protein
MHCTEAVAERMVRAYSETKISLDDFLELLTPRQTELKVAPSLVFLAGLVVVVVHDDETKAKKRFTTRQQALFSKLQQIYNDSNASSMARPFTLSPALLPSPRARLEIQARVVEFEQELTKESNAVFETLFQDENVMKTNGNNKRGGGMKKKKSKAVLKEKTTTTEASIDDDDDNDSNKVGTKGMNVSLCYVGGSRNDANDFSTLDSEDDDSFLNEEDFLVAALSSDVSLPKSRQQETDDATTVLTPIQVAATNVTQDKDSSWKQVKSKRAVRTTETKMSQEHETRARQDEQNASGGKLQQNEAKAVSDLDAKESQHELDKEDGNPDFDSVSESWSTERKAVPTETRSAQHTERPPTSSNENHFKSIATNTDTIATMTRSSPTQNEQDFLQTTIQTLQQQVQQLQAQLAQHEFLLAQERQAHSKVLQQHEERMQALQLKCYISETRGRAFEEALEQHNAAVANNVALTTPRKFTTTRRINANETDAPSDVSTDATTNKPLYSRATSQNLNHTNN